MNVQVTAARVPGPLRHVLTKDLQRPHAHRHQGTHVADEGEDGVGALERVGGRDRFPFLAEASVQPADDFALAKEDDEPLFDVPGQHAEVVHLKEPIPAQSFRRARG